MNCRWLLVFILLSIDEAIYISECDSVKAFLGPQASPGTDHALLPPESPL
jgi:hypothetical protein